MMIVKRKLQLNKKKIYICGTALLGMLFAFPAYSDSEFPSWQSTGDSISANIIYSTIASNLKQEPSSDIKIQSALLKKDHENGIAIEINLEILKPQFRGTVCIVDTSLSIQSITLEGSTAKIKSADVRKCNSNKGSGMNSLVRAAAGMALREKIPEIESNVQKSIDGVLIPMIKMLKEKTKQNVAIEYMIHEQGLAIYLHTGNLTPNISLKKLTYTVKNETNCMNQVSIDIFQLPSEGKNNKMRMFVRNDSREQNFLEAVMKSSVLHKEISSEKIETGSEFYWSDDQKKYSGKDFSVGLRLLSSTDIGKSQTQECGTMSLAVPEGGSVMIQIAR